MRIFVEEKIKYFFLSIIIILELIIIGVVVLPKNCEEESNTTNEIIPVVEEKEEIIKDVIITKIKVDIKGAVKKAGVYELDEGARIADLIKMAGGLKSNASTKYLNLSRKLTDEMVVKVYTENQIKNMNIIYNVQEECKCPTEDITSCAGSSVIINGTNIESDDNNVVSSKISLNNGTLEELMTLSGIGEAKAKAIIEYREKNNGFKTIEEIMNVSGIGESAYNKIKDNITL